ncbi:hypothetical protein HN800_04840 [bacterium]|jgi:RHS repeat-associated protein|nr:hypothetical protein [bacterium]MBT4764395.1 hypothetical protein [bacterium]MBT5401766.1 hypothetical protein [bacterium]MBT6067638.1 hypothetical protein [bacterium]MBT6336074.1 hypothetical protein [bacterium]
MLKLHRAILITILVAFFTFSTNLLQVLAYSQSEVNTSSKTVTKVSKEVKTVDIDQQAEKTVTEVQTLEPVSNDDNELSRENRTNSDFNSLQSKVNDLSNISGLKGNFNVDKFSGASTYSYDIGLPSSRTLTPALSLSYNSLNSNHSFLGQSWNLSMSYIGLRKEKGVDTIYNDNKFEISFLGSNEKLFNTENNIYLLEKESSFLKIEKLNNHWLVTDKQGTKYYFGNTNNSRQINNNLNETYRWYLSYVLDTNNNFVNYNYIQDNNTIYPKNIRYTGNENIESDKEVRFQPYYNNDLTSQEKNIVKYTGGFKEEIDYNLESIEILINSASNNPVAYYNFEYDETTNQLVSILKTAIDENGEAMSYPATTFEYYDEERSYVEENISPLPNDINLSYVTNNETYENNEMRWFDINGDGTEDIVKSIELNNNIINEVYLNHLGTFVASDLTLPVAFVKYGSSNNYPFGNINNALEIFDINGDNKLDLIESYSINDEIFSNIYLNNSGSFIEADYPALPISFAKNIDGQFIKNNDYKIFDINGDSLSDLIRSYEYNGNLYTSTYINFGNGQFEENSNFNIPMAFSVNTANANLPLTSVKVLDINNDSLIDIVRSIKVNGDIISQVYLNKGNGNFNLDSDINIPIEFAELINTVEVANNKLKLIDINADNLPDFVSSYKVNGQNYQDTYLNQGNSKFLSNNDFNINLPFAQFDGTSFKRIANTFALDINHDGNIDFIKNYSTDSGENYFIQKKSNYLTSKRLKKIINPLGSEIIIKYQSSSYYLDENDNNSNSELPFIYDTVSEIEITNNGESLIETYNYAQGKYIYHDLYDKEFVGFGIVTSYDNEGDKYVEEYYHQGGGFNGTELGEYEDNKWKKGKLYKAVTYAQLFNDDFFKISEVRNKWESTPLNENVSFVYIDTTLSQINESDGSLMKAIQYVYDDYGNLIQSTDYAQVENNFDDYVINDLNDGRYITTTSYTTGEIQNETETQTFDINNNVLNHSRNYYDNLELNQIDIGNLTSSEIWNDDVNEWQTTYLEYNEVGNIVNTTNALNSTESFNYDDTYDYKTETTNALNQTYIVTYNKASGQIKETIDPNNYITESIYDPLGRLLETKQSKLNSEGLITIAKQEYSFTDHGYEITLLENNSLTDFEPLISKYYYNQLNQLIQIKREVQNGYLTYLIKYLPSGQIQEKTIPFLSNNLGLEEWPDNQNLTVSYEYDALDRVIQETNALGTVNYNYYLMSDEKEDIEGKVTRLTKDVRGNTISLTEYLNDEPLISYFEYNSSNQLISLTDVSGNVRNFDVNNTGNYTSIEDLHRNDETNFNYHEYTYDILGRKTSSIEPLANYQINYEYDELNRLINKNETLLNNNYTLTYDTGLNGIGRLNIIEGPNYLKEMSYDIAGNLLIETETINDKSFTTSYSYDDFNRLISTTYPNNEVINYLYDDYGNISKVTKNNNQEVTSNIVYDFLGQILLLEYANGVIQDFIYDPNQLYRLTNKIAYSNNNLIQGLEYEYSANGNLLNISNLVENQLAGTWQYGYDDLNRLLSVTKENGNLNYNINYQYDDSGNILFNSRVGNYEYDAIHPQAVTTAGQQQFSYDIRGNQTNQNNFNLSYDSENRLSEAISNNQQINWSYNLEGNLIHKQINEDNSVFNEYHINNTYQEDNNYKVNYIYLADQRIAKLVRVKPIVNNNLSNRQLPQIKPATTYYYVWDHLNSTSAVTDNNGNLTELIEYYPFGLSATDTNSDMTDYKYNDKLFDNDLELYFYGNRFYNPNTGRFISIDPLQNNLGSFIPAAMTSSQYQNAYSYANNNPVKYIDPDGQLVFLAALAVSALVGAAIDVAIEVGIQMYENKSMDLTKIDYKKVGKAAITGAIIGAAGFGVGTAISKAFKGAKAMSRIAKVSNDLKPGIKLTKAENAWYKGLRAKGKVVPKDFKNPNELGSFCPKTGCLELSKKLFKNPGEKIATIKHEFQHGLQAKKWNMLGRNPFKFEISLGEFKAYGIEKKLYKYNSQSYRKALMLETKFQIEVMDQLAKNSKNLFKKYGSDLKNIWH